MGTAILSLLVVSFSPLEVMNTKSEVACVALIWKQQTRAFLQHMHFKGAHLLIMATPFFFFFFFCKSHFVVKRKSSLDYLTSSPFIIIWISNSDTCAKAPADGSSLSLLLLYQPFYFGFFLRCHSAKYTDLYCCDLERTEGREPERAVRWSKIGRNLPGGTCLSSAGRLLEPGLCSQSSHLLPQQAKRSRLVSVDTVKSFVFFMATEERLSVFPRNPICPHSPSPWHDLYLSQQRGALVWSVTSNLKWMNEVTLNPPPTPRKSLMYVFCKPYITNLPA